MIRTGLYWSGAALLALVAIAIWASGALPDSGRIPLHWGLDGRPDRWGSPDEARLALYLFPAAAGLASIVFALAPALDPFRDGLRKSAKAYLAAWLGMLAVLLATGAGVAWLLVSAAGDADARADGLLRVVAIAGRAMMIVLGNYLPKTRQSFFLGIRTPWTLTSAIVWEKTHRLAGPLFIAAGLVGLIAGALLPGIWATAPLPIAALLAGLICVAYSFFAWRAASDRQTGPHFD